MKILTTGTSSSSLEKADTKVMKATNDVFLDTDTTTTQQELCSGSGIMGSKSQSIMSFRFVAFIGLILVIFFGLATVVAFIYVLSIQEQEVWEKDSLTDRPIIGVLAQEYYQGSYGQTSNTSYIAASYIKFIEGGGGRVVPIMINQTQEYYRNVFEGINGLIFPGGGVMFNDSGYGTAGSYLLELAIKANDKGDYFPVWGTCLGFEFFVYEAVGGKYIMDDCNAYNVTSKLKFTKEAKHSRLFGKAPSNIFNILKNKHVTSNFHRKCLTQAAIKEYQLDNIFKFLSWSVDPSTGLHYVSSMESRKYPIYGVQFHPEKNMYEWSWEKKIPHSKEAILTGQYFAQFLVNEARKNSHGFVSQEQENNLLIYNYNVSYTGGHDGGGAFQQRYFFSI